VSPTRLRQRHQNNTGNRLHPPRSGRCRGRIGGSARRMRQAECSCEFRAVLQFPPAALPPSSWKRNPPRRAFRYRGTRHTHVPTSRQPVPATGWWASIRRGGREPQTPPGCRSGGAGLAEQQDGRRRDPAVSPAVERLRADSAVPGGLQFFHPANPPPPDQIPVPGSCAGMPSAPPPLPVHQTERLPARESARRLPAPAEQTKSTGCISGISS